MTKKFPNRISSLELVNPDNRSCKKTSVIPEFIHLYNHIHI